MRTYFLAAMVTALNLTAGVALAEGGTLADIQKAGVIDRKSVV